MSNTHFFNKEDAERHAKKYGGKVVDNTHNNNPWVGNNYTVAGDRLSDTGYIYPIESDIEYFGYVEMTRGEHEAWMASKPWSEDVKSHHRKKFTGAMEFDADGYFDYVNY